AHLHSPPFPPVPPPLPHNHQAPSLQTPFILFPFTPLHQPTQTTSSNKTSPSPGQPITYPSPHPHLTHLHHPINLSPRSTPSPLLFPPFILAPTPPQQTLPPPYTNPDTTNVSAPTSQHPPLIATSTYNSPNPNIAGPHKPSYPPPFLFSFPVPRTCPLTPPFKHFDYPPHTPPTPYTSHPHNPSSPSDF
ncbi:extensin-like, partial [Homalodisca vitripennis]|uniref:extensin-like n=1 Tax=Homalodisca vitripennis TaxID=197043 RepID=UPI001EEA6B7C